MGIRTLKVILIPSSLGRQTIEIISLLYSIMTRINSKILKKLLCLLMLQHDANYKVLRKILLVFVFFLASSACALQNSASKTDHPMLQPRFNVSHSHLAENNGTQDNFITPKTGLMFIPWPDTEFYINGGLGFHSHDALSVNSRIDSGSVDPINIADPLTHTYGAGVGIRTTWLESLQSTLSVWWLDIDSEPLFESDVGSADSDRPSRRYGIEWANVYSPTEWLTFDLGLSFSRARFRDDEEGKFIPGAIESVVAAGATFHDLYGGFYGNTRLHYLGPRPLIEDNSVRSNSTFLLSVMLGYQFNKNVSVQAEIFNLLNLKDSTIDYFYRSRLPGVDVMGHNSIYSQAIEPLSFLMSLTVNF